MKLNSQSNTILNDKIKKNQLKKRKKKSKLIGLTCQTLDPCYETKTT